MLSFINKLTSKGSEGFCIKDYIYFLNKSVQSRFTKHKI